MGSQNNELLRRYLLGDLLFQDEERLEQEYFVDDKAWKELQAIEDDLIHAYLCRKLSERECQQFEQFFLQSPRNQRRTEVATLLSSWEARDTLAQNAHPKHEEHPRVQSFMVMSHHVAFALAGICTILIAFGIWLGIQNRSLRAQLTAALRLQIGPQLNTSNLVNPVGPPTSDDGTVSRIPSVSILLEPGLSRGTGTRPDLQTLPFVAIPATYKIALDMGQDNATEYVAVISTVEGKEITRINGVRNQAVHNGRESILIVSSKVLRRGDYVIRLYVADTAILIPDLYSFSIR